MQLDNLHYLLATVAIGLALYFVKESINTGLNNYIQNPSYSHQIHRIPERNPGHKDIPLSKNCYSPYPVITGAALSGSCACCIVVLILFILVSVHLKVPELITQFSQLAKLAQLV